MVAFVPIPSTLSMHYKAKFWYMNLVMVYNLVFSLKNWYGIFHLGIEKYREQKCVMNVYPAPRVKTKQKYDHMKCIHNIS